MTAPPAIHMVHVAGSHREVGAQIGSACAPVLREAVEFDADIPPGRTRADQLALVQVGLLVKDQLVVSGGARAGAREGAVTSDDARVQQAAIDAASA
ncbi:MAG TPA: hypothetical protein VGJ46_08055, partial [Candidatus Limnocylindrales bacterium]